MWVLLIINIVDHIGFLSYLALTWVTVCVACPRSVVVLWLLGICIVVETWGQTQHKRALLQAACFLLGHLFHLQVGFPKTVILLNWWEKFRKGSSESRSVSVGQLPELCVFLYSTQLMPSSSLMKSCTSLWDMCEQDLLIGGSERWSIKNLTYCSYDFYFHLGNFTVDCPSLILNDVPVCGMELAFGIVTCKTRCLLMSA